MIKRFKTPLTNIVFLELKSDATDIQCVLSGDKTFMDFDSKELGRRGWFGLRGKYKSFGLLSEMTVASCNETGLLLHEIKGTTGVWVVLAEIA